MTIAHGAIETSTDNLSIRIHERVAVARLLGEIDMSVTPQILDALSAVVPHVNQLDIHLDEITFMDSAGVHLLVRVHRCAQTHSVDIFLHNPTPKVQRVLLLTALHSVFHIR